MKTLQRLVMVAGLVLIAAGLGASTGAAEPAPVEAPALIEAPTPVEVQTPVDPIGVSAPARDDIKPAETAPLPAARPTMLKRHAAKPKEKPSRLSRLWGWMCYTPPRLPCSCGYQPKPYRPPLYTWATCPPGTCAPSHPYSPACAPPQPLVASRRADEPLPKPEMPAIVQNERPLVPGSSSVLAEKRDTDVVAPINYKSLPVVPDSPDRR